MMTLCMLWTCMPMPLKAITESMPVSTPTAHMVESLEISTLRARLQEIKAMDKSTLNAAEKKELRKETRSIKRQIKKMSGGVYFSFGAIIIILVLLILLLK